VAIDYKTDIGRVRLLVSDVDPDNLILSDEQVQAYLDMEGGRLKRAAASALDAIASSEALVSKVITTQDRSVDGSKVADALRKQAATLREQADDDDADMDHHFGIVEFSPYDWS
jgi:hypothetical protein